MLNFLLPLSTINLFLGAKVIHRVEKTNKGEMKALIFAAEPLIYFDLDY
jgi:hypothetical protein